VHNCPLCGKPTGGSISEGGVNFAICPECYEKEYVKKFKHPKRVESDPRRKGRIYYY